MRHNLLILFVILLCVSLAPSQAGTHGFSLSGKPLVELEAELRADPTLHKMEKIEVDGRNVLVVVRDVGSGAYVWVLQIYLEQGSLWGIAILQRIKTGDLEFQVDQERSELVVKSTDGRKILGIPFESLRFS